MGSPSPSNCNWNNLPNEIKLNIIHRLDRNSRLSLRTCSTSDYQLVDSIPYRTIQELYLWNDDDKWHFDITKNMYGNKVSFVFDAFQDFQNKLEEEIESCECINLLKAHQKETSKKLKLTKEGELLKVRELIFKSYNEDAPDVLAQIDPFHLQKLNLSKNCRHEDILVTPQVLHTNYLQVEGDSLTDMQLFGMDNPEVFLEHPYNVSMAGYSLFLKKCLVYMEKAPVYFRSEIDGIERGNNSALPDNFIDGLFDGINYSKHELYEECPGSPQEVCEYLVYTTSEKHQLKVKYCSDGYIDVKTVCFEQPIERLRDPEDQDSFKSVDCIKVSNERIIVTEKRVAPIHYMFDSTNEMESRLIEALNKLDYIKHLIIENTTSYRIIGSLTKQLTVGKLSIDNGELSPDFLGQIEPVHLKEIKVRSYTHTGRFYDMPQLIHAQKVEIEKCNIRDQQLLNLDAIEVSINTSNYENLTDSGINMYIKKILTKLNLHDYNFIISSPETIRIAADLYKDLNISSVERVNRKVIKYIINSNFPEFKMELTERVGKITGKRIRVADLQ